MVHTQVLVIFTLYVTITGVSTEDVVYRGHSNDGTYSEVRHSQGPGGATKVVTTYSSRILGGPGGVSVASGSMSGSPELANRILGSLNPFNPGIPSPMGMFGSVFGGLGGGFGPPLPFQAAPSGPFGNGVIGSGLEAAGGAVAGAAGLGTLAGAGAAALAGVGQPLPLI